MERRLFLLFATKSVQQMDEVTQQNAANAEETASAIGGLTAQAQALHTLVDKIVAIVSAGDSEVMEPVVSGEMEKGV